MELNFTSEENAFRQQVKEFVDREVTSEIVDRTDGLTEQYDAGLHQKLAANGWIGMQWPRCYGGQERSHRELVIFLEEMAYALAPMGRYVGTVIFVGDSINAYGTDWQREYFLPRIARGEITASLCLTEPDSGSDAAALCTEAREDGDNFFLSGQKIFISGAEISAYGMVVARTSPRTDKKSDGISVLLVDLNSDGVEIVPLWNIAGWRVNHIFFDQVRVPVKMLMGRKDEGWKHIIKETLNFERSSVARVGMAARLCDDLFVHVREAKQMGQEIPSSLLSQLAELKADVESWRLMSYRIAWMQSRGEVPGPDASIVKLSSSEGLFRLANLGMDILSHAGRICSGTQTLAGRLEWMYRAMQFHVTGGGTSEIQRNLIARLALGLPRSL